MKLTHFFAIALTAVVLLLAACGGGDDDDDTTGESDDTTTAASADPTDDGTEPTDDDDNAEPTEASDDGDGGEAVDACSLLTPDEVSAAIGEPVGDGEPALAVGDSSACEWTSTESANAVHIEVLAEGGAEWFDTVNFGQEDEPVEGIGDEASFDFIGVLDVVQGDVFVSVQIILFFSDIDEQEAAIALAETILERVQ